MKAGPPSRSRTVNWKDRNKNVLGLSVSWTRSLGLRTAKGRVFTDTESNLFMLDWAQV